MIPLRQCPRRNRNLTSRPSPIARNQVVTAPQVEDKVGIAAFERFVHVRTCAFTYSCWACVNPQSQMALSMDSN
jgi:hypothetical protein